ncbi:MAG: DUF3253 domain-containing protein [Proteobacteria bacterium]|nr:DUF3253 domain-containing protein [Pseudomonadota bacterium]MDA1058368.1 DUF3253 domain-containing protein [Pseudomonadota bacterium]
MTDDDNIDRDPAAVAILELIAAAPGGVRPEEVAHAMAERYRKPKDGPNLWRKYMHAVRQEALHLARDGDIAILRKGKAVDPNKPVKGLYRLATPDPASD